MSLESSTSTDDGYGVALRAALIRFFPVLMLIVLVTTPKYMMVMFTDDRGHLMLLASAVVMGMGIFVMKKMISFKI